MMSWKSGRAGRDAAVSGADEECGWFSQKEKKTVVIKKVCLEGRPNVINAFESESRKKGLLASR